MADCHPEQCVEVPAAVDGVEAMSRPAGASHLGDGVAFETDLRSLHVVAVADATADGLGDGEPRSTGDV
ncbi:hypothetical protein UG54_01515 [Gordonia sihwensis]|nr:hypothetical protein UG54_01515 [Gordonia sihwensis]